VSTETPSRHPGGVPSPKAAWANGYTLFAVSIMIVLGLWQVLAGLTAVLRAGPYTAVAGYTFAGALVAWGATVIVLGVLIGGAAVFVIRGRNRAATAVVVLAVLSMIANFVLIPYYPIWSLTIIGLSATLVWAMTAAGR
jgi:uncharacterized membrane protein YozB (DUF420 family)